MRRKELWIRTEGFRLESCRYPAKGSDKVIIRQASYDLRNRAIRRCLARELAGSLGYLIEGQLWKIAKRHRGMVDFSSLVAALMDAPPRIPAGASIPPKEIADALIRVMDKVIQYHLRGIEIK